MLTYTTSLTGPEFNELRDSVGWRKITASQAERGIANTAFIVCARDEEGRAVAMGRVLFDFSYTAYVGDIIVRPEYQHKGIGTKVVKKLMQMTMDSAEPGDAVLFVLHAGKGKEPFYENLGFEKRPNEKSGCGMDVWITKEACWSI